MSRMILLRKTTLVRVLAAVLLLCPYGVSRVVCVSPTGHEAVEDSLGVCCLPGAPSNPGFSKTTPCQGCTDYPLDSTSEIKGRQANSTHALSCGDTASASAGLIPPLAMASLAAMHDRDGQFVPRAAQSQTAVLRC